MEYIDIAASILSLIVVIISLVTIIKIKKSIDEQSQSKDDTKLLEQKIEFAAKQNSESVQLISHQMVENFSSVSKQMHDLTSKNYEQQIKLMETLNENADKQTEAIAKAISSMQESNEKKLDQMRKTVDEKLEETLNTRLNASFKTVSEQLQNVYKSLGEMKELSAGVTDNVKGLNRVLTNVKSRGTWAEVQLGNILDQTIPGMYETNVKTNPKYNGQVEFAVKIPSSEDDSITWLPVDSSDSTVRSLF